MSTSIRIELVGADRLIRMLASGSREAVPALARALYEEGQEIFRQSQLQVPHDTGVLMASGQLHHPSIIGGDVVVEITYGGNASAYAEVQHENMDFVHDPGRKAKYLEDPVKGAQSEIENNIVDRVEAIMRGLI